MLIDPTKFPGLPLPPTQSQLTGELTFGDFTVDDVPLFQIRTSAAAWTRSTSRACWAAT